VQIPPVLERSGPACYAGSVVILSSVSAILGVATALLLLVVGFVRSRMGRGASRWVRRALVLGVVSIPVHALLVVPAALAYLVTSRVGTRSSERAYDGPRISLAGDWQLRSGRGEQADPGSGSSPVPATTLQSRDGTPLRAFFVAPRPGVTPRATAILVHGLFRGAQEVEPVGAMFRQAGCEVVLLEYRNHGGSGRATPTFGVTESEDVLAAVDFVRARPGPAGSRPLILFGVSLGTAAVGLASPRAAGLGGVVVDAPLTNALATAERLLAGSGRRPPGFEFPWPFGPLILHWVGVFCGHELASIRPGDSLRQLGPDVPVLVIGGGLDGRMPPDEVTALYESLPQRSGVKDLWILPDADHGDVWKEAPDEYRRRIGAFVDRVVRR
jgi:alpha-beta hydrolase superfamily lysophospholipase